MSKPPGLGNLTRTLVDIGTGLGRTVKEEVKTKGKEARTAASQYLETLPSRAHTHTKGLPSALRRGADELRARMERHAGPDGAPVSNELAMKVLARGLKLASDKLVDHSSSQVARVEELSQPDSSHGSTGLRAQLKAGLEKTWAVQQQYVADHAATQLRQASSYVQREIEAGKAAKLAQRCATMSSGQDLASFKTSLLALPEGLRSRPLFALALNSWAYPPELRAETCEVFHELRKSSPDDGGKRLGDLSMDPHAVDDKQGAQAWLLASADERSQLLQAFQVQHDIGRDEVETRVIESGAADSRISGSDDPAVLAHQLGIETELGLQALQARRGELKLEG